MHNESQTTLKYADRITPELYTLYSDVCGADWSISSERFQQVSCQQAILAVQKDRLAGFVLVHQISDKGHIQVMVVASSCQSQGIGRALMTAAEQWLVGQGVREIHLGAGGSYLWQGVPDGLQHWFVRRGYTDSETNIDMSIDLDTFDYPDWVDTRLPSGMVFRTAAPDDADGLLRALEDEDLAEWKPDYASLVSAGRHEDILLALHQDEIVGAVMGTINDTVWRDCFPGPVGELACMGVNSAYRGKGVGRALAARVTLRLKDRGMTTGYLKWTGLEDWYGALGYRTWRRFHMMQKQARADNDDPQET